MKPDDPNVGTVLDDLTRQSIREMNAARRYKDIPIEGNRKRAENRCPDDLITIRQASELLGFSVSAIATWAWKGKISCVRVRGQRFFNSEVLRKEYKLFDHTRGRK